jgi:hypothetical protein
MAQRTQRRFIPIFVGDDSVLWFTIGDTRPLCGLKTLRIAGPLAIGALASMTTDNNKIHLQSESRDLKFVQPRIRIITATNTAGAQTCFPGK